ncbi:hypothetical protein [Bacillus wiedmannii]|uniref:hypothetical protein n=1 Tax=Bacillus wiedmannii TaxID=1890302 RepID=UPI003CF73912
MNNYNLSAHELMSIGYNTSLTDTEKMEAVNQLEELKKNQAEAKEHGFGNPFLKLSNAYNESTSRREERQQQELFEAKMKRLEELEAKAQKAREEHESKQKLEADMARLKHLEDVEKAGLM